MTAHRSSAAARRPARRSKRLGRRRERHPCFNRCRGWCWHRRKRKEQQQQSQADLRWIREPFLFDDTDHGFVVVHGHTISDEVEERPNRIGIDTGAYRSGVLTALAIEGTDRWLLDTGNKEGGFRAAD